jgi:hypothetical protein
MSDVQLGAKAPRAKVQQCPTAQSGATSYDDAPGQHLTFEERQGASPKNCVPDPKVEDYESNHVKADQHLRIGCRIFLRYALSACGDFLLPARGRPSDQPRNHKGTEERDMRDVDTEAGRREVIHDGPLVPWRYRGDSHRKSESAPHPAK